jgi:hypothetical protein
MIIRSPHQLIGLIPFCIFSLLAPCLWAAQNQPESGQVQTRLQQTEAYHRLDEEQEADAPAGVGFSLLGSDIRLNGLAEFNAEYLDIADLEDPRREDSSDFYVGTLELTTRVFFNEWSRIKLVLSAEDFGKNGEEGQVVLSEAIATLEAPWYPLYLIAGRTQMPFGVFEDRLIEGTLTEEIYEIDAVGIIMGLAPDLYGLDLAFAFYERPAIIDNLEDFDAFEKAEGRPEEDRFASYALMLSARPLEDVLYLNLFYDNEPGDGRRNQSLGGAIGASVWRLSADAEWIAALTREAGENERENKEAVWVVGLAVELTEAVELGARHEHFDDDDSGEQDEILDYRWVAGGNYQFAEWATFSLEYRYSKFEKEPDSDIEDQQHMIMLQLALEY